MDKKTEFSKAIDDFIDGNINPYAQIFICKTTDAMLACGAKDLDVIINQSTLRKIMSNDTAKYKHPHNLDENIIKSIPNELNNPIMIFNGSAPSSIVLISALTDENNKNIIISCKLNSEKSIYEVNEITSIYPKNNIANYINTQLENHNLIGCNKKIANRLLKSLGLQSSEVEASIDYTDSIRNFADFVKITDNKILENNYTKSILQKEKIFSNTLDEFLKGNINPTDQIFVCSTTEVMKRCGADNLDIMIYQDTIRKILSDDFNKFEHPHNLSVDILKRLPDQLQNPLMVFKGSHKSSIVLVTDLFNEENEQIIVSCELNSINKRHEINRITSMYGKKDIVNYISVQIKKDNLIGCHKKIANQMLQSVGLYLPSEETFIDYSNSICFSAGFVKTPDDKILESNHSTLKDILIKNNESPAEILSDKELLQWYSFSSQISNPDEIKNTLQNILKNEMKIVSVQPSSDGYKLIQLDETFNLQKLDETLFSSEREAFNAALANNNISKIVSYDNIINSSVNKSFNDVLNADNLKYPHIKIEWSENETINNEDRLSLQATEKLFSEQAKINQDSGTIEETQLALFIDSNNTYSFNIGIGESNGSIIEYIQQHLTDLSNDILEKKSFLKLQEYLNENFFGEQELQSNQEFQIDLLEI